MAEAGDRDKEIRVYKLLSSEVDFWKEKYLSLAKVKTEKSPKREAQDDAPSPKDLKTESADTSVLEVSKNFEIGDTAETSKQLATATHSFVPSIDDELGFSEGDQLLIHNQTASPSWWIASSVTNPKLTGKIPACFVRIYDETENSSNTSIVFVESSPDEFSKDKAATQDKGKVDFLDCSSDLQVLFSSPNLNMPTLPTDNKLSCSPAGVSPGADLTPNSKKRSMLQNEDYVPPKADIIKVLALFSFDGSGEKELAFKKGDLLFAFKLENEAWWIAELNGSIGFIPSNYVQKVSPWVVNKATGNNAVLETAVETEDESTQTDFQFELVGTKTHIEYGVFLETNRLREAIREAEDLKQLASNILRASYGCRTFCGSQLSTKRRPGTKDTLDALEARVYLAVGAFCSKYIRSEEGFPFSRDELLAKKDLEHLASQLCGNDKKNCTYPLKQYDALRSAEAKKKLCQIPVDLMAKLEKPKSKLHWVEKGYEFIENL